MKERTDKQQRFQQVLKYFALCVIVLAMSFFTGEKTVFAKLNVTGDKSLLKESKCTQTFDGTKDFVIWCNPAKIKSGVEVIIYGDGADACIYDTTGHKPYRNSRYIKSVNKNGKIVLKKEALIEFYGDFYGHMANPYKGFIGLSIGNGKSSVYLNLAYDLTKIKNQKYTIVYDTNGGDAMKSRSVRLYEKFPNVKPTRKGYTFTGWIEKQDHYDRNLGEWVVVCRNMKVVAIWKLSKYSISYKYNGGTKIGEKDNPTSYTVNSKILLAAPGRTGYTFEGWYTDKNYKNRIKKISGRAGNLTLYAKWSPKRYQITFQANGGSKINKKLSVAYDSVFGKLPVPKRKDYTFAGWYTKKKGGTKITAKTKVMITKNMRLYAQWTPIDYKISYYSNMGGMVNDNRSSYNVTMKNFNLTDPTLEGYTFEGWYTGKNYKKKANTTVQIKKSKNMSFYAKFTENTYTLQYDANGGTGSMKGIKCVYSQTYTLQGNQFINGDRKFTGWNTDKDGKGTAYADGAKISKLCARKNGSVILYAQWKKDVSVHAYSGGVSTGSIRRVSQKSNLYANGWVYNNVDYTGVAGSECGAASSSMAVSYLGVDISPGEICYRSGNGKIPFETAWISWGGITPRLNFDGSQFGNYFNDYENDASYKYSPVIILLTVYPGSNNHFVVVIGKNSDGTYKICDPVDGYSTWDATISGNHITGLGGRVNCNINKAVQYVK